MGKIGHLKRVEKQLIKDLQETILPLKDLGEKYGVTRQAISLFALRRRINRPNRGHIENCSICQRLLRIAEKPRSDFLCAQTIGKQLELGSVAIGYHIRPLRKKHLISRNFGRLRSRNVELAYAIYFREGGPLTTIGRRVGIRNFYSIVNGHKKSGWNVPDPYARAETRYEIGGYCNEVP